MGSGYKLVAASLNVSEDEKREITQRAPSHANLCDNTPDAEGLACFTLRSGRQCAFLSRHAGPEPSGRGGFRIHTHVLLLSPEQYRALSGDVLSLRARVAALLDWQALPANQRALDPLDLAQAARPASPALAGPLPADFAALLAVLASALECRRQVVWNAPRPIEALGSLLDALPRGRRERLSCAVGMRHSTQRDFDLVFGQGQRGEFEQITADEAVVGVDWSAPPPGIESDFCDWLSFARRCWENGRGQRLRDLADRLGTGADAATLAAVARLETLTQRVAVLSFAALEQVLEELSGMPLDGALELELSEQLRTRIAERKRELTILTGR